MSTTTNTVTITVDAAHGQVPNYLASAHTEREVACRVKLGPFQATRKTTREARDAVTRQLTTWATAWEQDGGTPVTVAFRGFTTIAWLAPDDDGPTWQTITVHPDGHRRGITTYAYVPSDVLDARLRLAAAQHVDPHDDAEVAQALAFITGWGGLAYAVVAAEFRDWVGYHRALAHAAQFDAEPWKYARFTWAEEHRKEFAPSP